MANLPKLQQAFKNTNTLVIIPTYNNGGTLQKVLDDVLKYTSNVLVVNDGCTDQSKKILATYLQVNCIHFTENKGKGLALRAGFNAAIENGYQYAITMDSDGQHLAKDLENFMETIEKNPSVVVMGSRNLSQEGVPSKSNFGNKFSNFWFHLETGWKLPDTQTGFRLYPLKPLKNMRFYSSKFEFEIEVIVRLAWEGIPFIPIPIDVVYDPKVRVSHFRPLKDFTRISILNTLLVALALLYHIPKRIWKRGIWNIVKSELYKPGESPFKKALSIGFGFFIGIAPIWGFQLAIGIPLSILFKMNKVLFISAANISIPPMIPFIIWASYTTGNLLLGQTTHMDDWSNINLDHLQDGFYPYIIGATTLSLISFIAGFTISYVLFSILKKRNLSKTQA